MHSSVKVVSAWARHNLVAQGLPPDTVDLDSRHSHPCCHRPNPEPGMSLESCSNLETVRMPALLSFSWLLPQLIG